MNNWYTWAFLSSTIVLVFLSATKIRLESVFWMANRRLNSHDNILSNIGGKPSWSSTLSDTALKSPNNGNSIYKLASTFHSHILISQIGESVGGYDHLMKNNNRFHKDNSCKKHLWFDYLLQEKKKVCILYGIVDFTKRLQSLKINFYIVALPSNALEIF